MPSAVGSSATSFYSAVSSKPSTNGSSFGWKSYSSDRAGEASALDDFDQLLAEIPPVTTNGHSHAPSPRKIIHQLPHASLPSKPITLEEPERRPANGRLSSDLRASSKSYTGTNDHSNEDAPHAYGVTAYANAGTTAFNSQKSSYSPTNIATNRSSPFGDTASKSGLSTPPTATSAEQSVRDWRNGEIAKPIRRMGPVAADKSRYKNGAQMHRDPRNTALLPQRHPLPRRPPREMDPPIPPFRNQAMPRAMQRTDIVTGPQTAPRHFEIRISNIPPEVKQDELASVLAEHLHQYPFSTRDYRINFWLKLPQGRGTTLSWGQANAGYGFLTLPTVHIANVFMSKYGPSARSPITVRTSGGRQPIKFDATTNLPHDGVLENINRVPYPEKADRSQRMINDRKAESLKLERLEFGVFCRDGVYSPEYITVLKNTDFFFDARHKTFRLSQTLDGAALGYSPDRRSVLFRSSAIRLMLLSVSDNLNHVTLIMRHAPAYESLPGKKFNSEPDPQDDDEGRSSRTRDAAGRIRSSAFDSSITAVQKSAFTSRAISFVFDNEQNRDDFENLMYSIGCPPARFVSMENEERHLYDDESRIAVMTWLKRVPSRSVAFQLARLYQNCLLTPPELLTVRPIVEKLLASKGPYITADVVHQYVEELTRLEDRWLDRILKDSSVDKKLSHDEDIVDVLEALVEKGLHRTDWREHHQSSVMQCLHVIMTPTSMILEGPYSDQSNRPLRKYGNHDHFIRVSFMDEDRQPYFWGYDIDWTAFLDERVGKVLRTGINLGGRKYDFLGYSMSSLRNRSTWFCTKFNWYDEAGKVHEVDANFIRDDLGDFENVKRQPARYGARMAQAFTATDPSIVLQPHQISSIPDVERLYRGETACFTDGVGKISMGLTKQVWSRLHNGMEPAGILPSAFQFRLGGYKGVLTVDSELPGEQICVRPSQQKFDAPDSLALEIAYSFCRYIPMFLNRPLIKVLEDLAVPHQIFLDLLKEAVIKAEDLKHYIRETRLQLTLHGLGNAFSVTELVENVGQLLRTNRIDPFRSSGNISKFIAESLGFAEVHILRMLKLKARIPILQAHVGVAVADESGVLKENEIYTLRHNPGEPPQIIEGKVLLVRAPTVDTGDVQFAHAVGIPPPGAERFKHLPNVVIFSIRGESPLLSSLARGDMDGDLVSVIYDRRLFPMRTEPAMQHKPKRPVVLDRDCTIKDVIDFVLNFFRNDMLGQIATRHLLIADQAPAGFLHGCGTRHPFCKKLAALQTIAVDAPKSGQSVDLLDMPPPLFPHRPDFMRHDHTKGGVDEDNLIYQSSRILGKLYRAIRLSSEEEDNKMLKEAPRLNTRYVPTAEDDDILLAIIEHFEACGLVCTQEVSLDKAEREQAWYTLHTYASDLRHIAYSNSLNAGQPLSEHELFIGTILHGTYAIKVKQEMIQRLNLQCAELVDQVLRKLEGRDGRDVPQNWANRILAYLRIAVSESTNFGAQTFGAIAVRSALYLIASRKDVMRTDQDVYEHMVNAPFEDIVVDDWHHPTVVDAGATQGGVDGDSSTL